MCRGRPGSAGGVVRAHGTQACYVWGPEPGSLPGRGCRCDECRAASSAYNRALKRRVVPTTVDAEPVREHLRELGRAGVGLKQITRLTGVSGGALAKIIYGTPRADGTRRPPARRVRVETRDRLLAVKPSDQADGAWVPAKETWRHVETLLGRGWTKAAIAARLGQTSGRLQLGTMTVTAHHARVIRGLLDEPVPPRRSRWGVHEVPAPDPEVEERERLRRAAEAERRATYRAAARGGVPSGPGPGLVLAEWMADARCRAEDVPTWLFFADVRDQRTVQAAKAVCARCPVRAQCHDHAVRHGEAGVWGGTTDAERERGLAPAVAS